jgi:hypothetical protein
MDERIGIMRDNVTAWSCWRWLLAGAVLVCLTGCYADRLPEPVKQLGVPRIEAIEVQPLDPVSLEPGATATVPVRLKRNGNEGPIAVSLSQIPSGVEVTCAKEIPADKSELEISLVGGPALGDRDEQLTVTVMLTMAGATLEPSFSLTLPKVPRPVITTLPPVFLQPGNAVDLLVPIERNGYSEPLSLEPIELPEGEGIVCDLPEEPIEDNSLPIHLAAAEILVKARLVLLLKTTVYGREVSAPLTVVVTMHPFTLPAVPVVELQPGQTRDVELPIERDSLESLSRLVTGGLRALTGVQLVPESFAGPILISATSPDDAISIDAAEVAAGSSQSSLTVRADDMALPGAVSIPLAATADHLKARGLLVVRVADTDTAAGELSEAIMEAIAPPKRIRPGGVAGRNTAEAKRLLGRRYGQTAEARKTVGLALEWLTAAQTDDGSWQASSGQTGSPGAGQFGGGSGATADTVTTTAAALLPFLAEGVTHEPESADAVWLEAYPEVVKNGLLWLGKRQIEASQQVPGLISEDLGGQCLGLIAFSEALALSGDRQLTQNAKLAAKQLADRQADDGGWPQGDTVTPLATARAVLALEAAKACGVGVLAGNLRRAEKYLEQSGVGGSSTPLAAYAAVPDGPPDPTATAACLLAWQYAELPQDTPDLLAAAEAMASLAPGFEDEPLSQPIDFLLFAGDVLRNLEGDRYDRWNAQVSSFLCRTQLQEGDNTGSWNPEVFAGGRDRVSTTALATLCLQAAYRALPAYRQ